MFLQYINNKHYKISPSGRNDEAIREKEGRKDGGEAAIFSSHNIDLAVILNEVKNLKCFIEQQCFKIRKSINSSLNRKSKIVNRKYSYKPFVF